MYFVILLCCIHTLVIFLLRVLYVCVILWMLCQKWWNKTVKSINQSITHDGNSDDILPSANKNIATQECTWKRTHIQIRWETTQRTAWMDSWPVTQRILCDFCNRFLTSIRRNSNTVECRYNAVQYCTILHKKLPELRENINQMLDPQKTRHTSP